MAVVMVPLTATNAVPVGDTVIVKAVMRFQRGVLALKEDVDFLGSIGRNFPDEHRDSMPIRDEDAPRARFAFDYRNDFNCISHFCVAG